MCHYGSWHVAWEKVLVHAETQMSSNGVLGLMVPGHEHPSYVRNKYAGLRNLVVWVFFSWELWCNTSLSGMGKITSPNMLLCAVTHCCPVIFVYFACHQMSIPVTLSVQLLPASFLPALQCMIITTLAPLPAPASSSCSSLGLFCFVTELCLGHVPAFMLSLYFLHSQTFGYVHITFLVFTCTFLI